MKNILPFVVLGIVVIAGTIFFLHAVSTQPQILPAVSDQVEKGQRSPDISLEDLQGKVVRLSDFLGKTPVVINLWASWCPFCLQELPDFAKIGEEFKGKVLILAVNRQESKETAKHYLDERGVLGKITVLLDFQDAVYKNFHAIGMPTSIFIDRQGRIQSTWPGQIAIDHMREKIKMLLES